MNLPAWVEDARRFPLRFAQVREDPRLDGRVVSQGPHPARIVMVASGGCTAADLAASGLAASIRMVDPNPAQIALARLKLSLLGEPAPVRLALLGHAPMPDVDREEELRRRLGALELAEDALGPLPEVVRLGPDHSGRYEMLFAALSRAFAAAGVDPSSPTDAAIEASLEEVMKPPNLQALFGEDATRHPRVPFARHFAARLRLALARADASENPFLWQMLIGRFPPGASYSWLSRAACVPPPISWTIGPMDEALAENPEAYDFVHLSNILDWLSLADAARTLRLATEALAPGGAVFVRQLNSRLDISALGPDLEWQAEEAQVLLEQDRSFFYRALHVGRKR